MSHKHDMDAQAGCLACEFEPFVRNNYFTGKMMGASDFIAETHFHQEKLRLHQARLHGWGVICGLLVLQHPNADCQKRYVRIEPGSALDCCGQDILVPEEEILDVLAYAAVANLARENPAKVHALGICVRFVECPTENVPVLYDECGCDDDGCAPNRILESYAFDVIVDPPLNLMQRLVAADLTGALFARAIEPMLGANTPRFGQAALAGNVAYVLDAAHPTELVAYDISNRHAEIIELNAEAYAVAANGGFAFVATAPKTGDTSAALQIFKPGSNSVVTSIDVAETSATDTLLLATSSNTDRHVIAYVPESGALLAFAQDTTNGVDSAAKSLGTTSENLRSFVVKDDGTVAFAVDAAGEKVIRIDLPAQAASTTDVRGMPAGSQPSSVAYLEIGGKDYLAAASRFNRSVYLVDLAAADASAVTLTLDHAPEFVAFVAATGELYLLEEDGGADFLQTVDLAPLANGKPQIAASRMVGGTGLRLLGLMKDGSSGLMASAEQLDVACAELIWHQSCTACDTPNCVQLATIERYQSDAAIRDWDADAKRSDDIANKLARINNRNGRKVLASTQTLQEWLECIQTKGTQGPTGPKGEPGKDGANGAPGLNGKDGLGLYRDLPKILDIGWSFEEHRNVAELSNLYSLTGARNKIIENIKKGNPPPLFTIYFNRKKMQGITRQTFNVRIDAPMPAQNAPNQYASAGVYLPIELRMYGDIIPVSGTLMTPHTQESAGCAVTFVPSSEFFPSSSNTGWPYWLLLVLIYVNQLVKPELEMPCVRIELKGDFVYAAAKPESYNELEVLDGDNVGGRVGMPPPEKRLPPLLGGNNPSGNLTQGGLFESWFFLQAKDANLEPLQEKAADLRQFLSETIMGTTPKNMPPTANFSTEKELTGAGGATTTLVRRIVEERNKQPFAGVKDFRKRIELNATEWTKLKSKIVIL